MSTFSLPAAVALAISAILPIAAFAQRPGSQLPAPQQAPPMAPDALPPPLTSLPPSVEVQQETWGHLPPPQMPAGSAFWSAGAPHLVLRPHAPVSATSPHAAGYYPSHAASHRENVAGPRPALPGATTLHLQKTPYSYGYFGASGRRHWSLHFGHQQSYTQWTKR